jgi:ssDNA-binding Zn-finger/Zn-ribbon topoisomerase 1
MVMRETTKYPNSDGTPRKFLGCINFPKCRGSHGVHQSNGKMLGYPANQETKEWRMKAHETMIAWMKRKGYDKKKGYEEMAKLLNMEEKDAHIGKFFIVECQNLIQKLSQEE